MTMWPSPLGASTTAGALAISRTGHEASADEKVRGLGGEPGHDSSRGGGGSCRAPASSCLLALLFGPVGPHGKPRRPPDPCSGADPARCPGCSRRPVRCGGPWCFRRRRAERAPPPPPAAAPTAPTPSGEHRCLVEVHSQLVPVAVGQGAGLVGEGGPEHATGSPKVLRVFGWTAPRPCRNGWGGPELFPMVMNTPPASTKFWRFTTPLSSSPPRMSSVSSWAPRFGVTSGRLPRAWARYPEPRGPGTGHLPRPGP